MNWKAFCVFLAVFAIAVCRPLTIAYLILVWGISFVIGIYLLFDYLRHEETLEEGTPVCQGEQEME